MPQTPQSECRLKAGHAPAVKAGGMRITQNKPEKEQLSTSPPSHAESDEALVSTSPPKTQIKQIINGCLAKGDADFPAEAVKSFHDNKPQPQHEFRQGNTGNHAKPMMIQQPRK